MRFYAVTKQFYCGVDLHAREMYVCIINAQRKVLVHKNIKNRDVDTFISLIEPYKHEIVVGCESTYAWYWLADLCADNNIEFILGHALYMKAIHGGKTKNDRIDSHKIALLIQAGMFPLGYVYPRKDRPIRDLLRRRLHFTRMRAKLISHVQLINTQHNFQALGVIAKSKVKRDAIPERFNHMAMTKKSLAADLSLIDYYTNTIKDIEQYILSHARLNNTKELAILQSMRGIGDIISLTILFEIGDIARFETVQQFASYSRVVTCPHESAGKLYGASGKKIGNEYLKNVFSEAAVFAVKFNERIEKYFDKLKSKKGTGKAYSIIAHKIAKAVYFMLKNGTVFDESRFLSH
jgi:transposase